ncbi:MAG TPA: ribosome recycling factor [Chitinophagales bacterium]|nr:ribosome recycling factor [Chitinophagales bacterium]HRK28942.1 ribosome recycling factor [Chitinophagales bacterium]
MLIDEANLEIEAAEELMKAAVVHLQKELEGVRAGKASPAMLQNVYVDYYGAHTPVSQVANISVNDARTISIQPWERNMIGPIEKAIFAANMGVTPQNDGQLIRITLPPMTQERRLQLVKQVKDMGEHTRVSIRNARREAIHNLKKLVKDGLSEDLGKQGEHDVQELTNKYIDKTDKVIHVKEEEIMTI